MSRDKQIDSGCCEICNSHKQIEEMALTEVDILANDIYQSCPDLRENYCGDTHCVACLAHALTAKGYRKIEEDPFRRCTCLALGCDIADDLKRDVAEEIFAEIVRIGGTSYGDIILNPWDIAELKKKYTKGKDK